MPPELSTPPQLAKQLGVGPRKILAWIASGELTAINLAADPSGRPVWRITADALERFFASRQATPATTQATTTRTRRPKPKREWF
jgi:hypothetical protein